ncbi:MAG: ASPIC/UnbV domain-containing protein [Pirellulales bacterium]|nr:ASPIC/UnbV domain-containing protein [Pirellulales bacterium]
MSRSPDDELDRNAPGRNEVNLLLSMMMLEGRSFSGHERNCCYLNCGSSPAAEGRFANVSATSGIDFPDDGRALVVVDWDNDGDLDLWTSNRNAPRLRFLRNEMPKPGRFVRLQLIGNGTSTNRDAIGARVELVLDDPSAQSGSATHANLPKLAKTLHAGEGFLSQNSKWLHFGVGEAEKVHHAIVHWPDGTREKFGPLATNTRYVIKQNSPVATPLEPDVRQLALHQEDQQVPPSSQKATLRLVTPLAMPPLPYQTLTGENQRLQTESGRPLLINLWATWCQPCLKELKDFSDHAQQLREAGLEVIALSVDGLGENASSPQRAAKYLQSIDFPFRSGKASEMLVSHLQKLHDLQTMLRPPLPLPTSFLINGQGNLIAIYKGPVSVTEILEELRSEGGTDGERFEHASAIGGRVIEDAVTQRTFDMIEAERRFNFASWLQEIGLEQQAADQYRTVMQLWPDSAKAHMDFASAMMRQGQLKPAEHHLKKALSIDPESSGVHLRLGNLYLQQRQLSRALDHLQKAELLSPKDVSIINNLGTIYSQLGDTRRAIDEFTKAIQLMPTEAGGYNNLAWLLATCTDAKFRDPQKAISLANKACELTDWNHFPTLDTLATTYAEVGNFKDAVRWQAKALEVAPESQKAALRERLDRYRQGKSYRTPETK